ncbi:MAG TPA: arylsulfatase [Humisphaera sp.]
MTYARPPLVVLVLSALLALAPTARAADPRPNIVVILADDMGYSDLGCYGGEIRTPNLGALAAKGLRFTQFYNGGRCCPTRASLLTGLYPHQAGIGRMTTDPRPDLRGYRGTLGDNTVTVAEVLKASGYRTAMVGKWHVSLTEPVQGKQLKYISNQEIRPTFSDPATYPVGRGFEQHYGIIWGVANYYDPFSLVDGTEPVREVPKGYYITDALSDRAAQYIDGFAKGSEPFFLYCAYTAPHWPLHAPEADVLPIVERYKGGWDAVREARFKRMREAGALPPGADAMARVQGRNGTWADNPTKDWDVRAMAVHAAMVERMDRGIGKIVAKLKETGRLDNTLILFLSDNGASPEAYPNSGFDRPAQTRDGRKVAYPPNKTVMPGPEDTCFGFGPAWANAVNTPLRAWKAEMYEGGICTPMVAHWPAGLKAEPGAVTPQVGHVMDLMPTFLEMAGAQYPKEFKGHPITPVAGKSLLPVLQGKQREGHAAIGWEHFNARAFREGDWKLVARGGGKWELYDLSKDRGENNDLAAAEPDRLSRMKAGWEKWAAETDVTPGPEKKR